MESFNLNIIPGKDRPVCHASQYDIGRTIHVNLFEGFNVFTLDGTEVISISVRKPDGNVVTESVTNTSDSYVEFVTTEQMTACSGSNLCELKLEKGADVIGTMNFILEVEQDPLDGGVQSDTNIYNLQTQVANLVAIEVADQYDSGNVIFDNTPTAGHGVGYAVTSEGVLNALGSLQTTLEGEIDTVEDIIGDAYDENNTYNTDDYCIYSDVLYKCNDDNVTGPWDATKWDATTVADELALKQNVTDANLQTTDQTVVGAINELNTGLSGVKSYRCKYAYTAWGTSRSSEYTHVPFFRVQIDLDYYIASNGGDYINIRNLRTGTTQTSQIPTGQTSVSVSVDGYTFTKNVSDGEQNLVITTPSNKPIFIEYYM